MMLYRIRLFKNTWILHAKGMIDNCHTNVKKNLYKNQIYELSLALTLEAIICWKRSFIVILHSQANTTTFYPNSLITLSNDVSQFSIFGISKQSFRSSLLSLFSCSSFMTGVELLKWKNGDYDCSPIREAALWTKSVSSQTQFWLHIVWPPRLLGGVIASPGFHG